MSEKYVDIGNRLGYIRTVKLDMTQERMAEKLGISVEYYRLLEKGKCLLNLNMAELLRELYSDLDFILMGKEAGKSAFAEVFEGISEIRRDNICNLILYQMKNMSGADRNGSDIGVEGREHPSVMLIREESNIQITPNDRIREIILGEHNYGKSGDNKMNNEKINNEDIAKDLNKSQRTFTRWLGGKATLKMDMIVAVCEKYGHSPTYILYGELNSNSQVDKYYSGLREEEKRKVMEFAKMLVKFI